MPKDVNDKKEKKENKHFFKDFKAELKRVIWPTPKQLVNNTVAVITIVLQTKQEITLLIMKQVIQQTLQKMKQVTLLIQQTQMQRLITQKINN